MSNRGSAFLLKIGDGSPDNYATVAGLKTSNLTINGEPVGVSVKQGWRELLSGAGVRSVDVVGNGIFTGSAGESEVRNNALAGTIDSYELSFESGERLRGRFLVTRLDYTGDFNGERNYTVALSSSGEVVTL